MELARQISYSCDRSTIGVVVQRSQMDCKKASHGNLSHKTLHLTTDLGLLYIYFPADQSLNYCSNGLRFTGGR
jgi:hypothetical protein